MRNARALVWIASAALCGCGLLSSDPCSKADQAVQALASKTSSCSSPGLDTSFIKGKSACDAAVKDCTAADKTVLSEELDCVINLSACVSGKEKEFGTAFGLCIAGTTQLTAGCKQGFGIP